MFKAQVLRRNFSLFNRVPYARIARSAARDGYETVRVQRFSIKTPFFSRSRVVGAAAISGALYGLTRYIGIEVDVEDAGATKKPSARSAGHNSNQDEGAVSADEEDIEDDDGEALLFLPTGFSRPRPHEYFKGSDPEWQEFIKVSKDQKRVRRIRQELVAMVRSYASKMPGFVARLGNIDPVKGNAWLEIKFPDGPVPEYERPGIELTEDLQWRKASRPVETRHHDRLQRLMFPKEAAISLYKDTKRRVEGSWRGLTVYLGWEQKSDPQTTYKFDLLSADKPIPRPSAPVDGAAANSSSTSPAKDIRPSAVSPIVASVEGLAKDLGVALPDSKSLKLDLTQFRQDFRKEFKSYPPVTPRGAFPVLGFVEVIGDRARMTMHVIALYDPKQGKYIHAKMSTYTIKDNKQKPRGGP